MALTLSDQDIAYSDDELAKLNVEFEDRTTPEIIEWAVSSFAPHLSLTASMTDAVLIDQAVKVEPAIEVVFIDTGYHFPETLETMERIRRHYGMNLKVMTVQPQSEDLWVADPENCCSAVKVGQLDRALQGKLAWMSGLRRTEAITRATAPVVGRDIRGLVKINPIATWTEADVQGYIADHGVIINPLASWTDQDVEGYIADHDVIVNPLRNRGYLSIGCQPCTHLPTDPNDPRSGRWIGQDKTECGLHD